ncbi:hypothetical protein BIY21_06840 [Vibrio ponticus]|uniref:DUF4145 domain-containing protein n=1 Tax=Vibrio ponticus TaxID=265668 RepID=A0ABX3FQV9_9VIBR|nr:DUF4145 domain-containing protein [Vibrio ponticus]OLQ95161.1 hypothetical protein BIY21_06840 [Vibrio ponticus]
MHVQPHFENNTQDNFSFLKDGLEELYNQAVLAERYYFTDPQSSLAKMRLFVELACHELGKQFKLRPPVHGDLANKIKMLQASQRVDEWVIDEMNHLRYDGNRSVHMTEVNGAYIAKLSISRARMQKHMNSLYEIAHYVGQMVLGTPARCTYTWQEPNSCELSLFVADALKGSKEASFYLATRFYNELLEMSQQVGDTRWWRKEHYLDKQADLTYWLEKTHRLGHEQSWLLLAKCYANKLLQEESSRDAKLCFKQALNIDQSGEAAFEFGSYLIEREEHKLGVNYIRQAAEQGYHPALSSELSRAFKTKVQQSEWLELALEHRVPEAFTADVACKLKAFEAEQTESALKALRSSLVTAQARRAPAVGFFQSYVELTVNKVSDTQSARKKMVDEYPCMPTYLEVELLLFKQIAEDPAHYDLMLDIYHDALKQASDELGVADVKYSIVKHALVIAAEKFKLRAGVKTPKPIPTLLKEAADAGHAEARRFVNSAEGKAVLKKVGFTSQGKMQKDAAQKLKNKRKRKMVKKVKRK